MTATVDTEKWTTKPCLGNVVREHPLLRIRGKWMEAAGFTRGTKVEINIDGERLVITKKKGKTT
jgi:hypothetical protein